ncbi:hypothetical protein E2C01_075705 [Portunus trituberculatus]|uniref:Uncharacterized protein n=1 Tax=Portunus trituberculatus TaxID=210409 RepID=A0A5B7IFN3_PORTR|nr:hypothetical protein [Portunus trituberculatus]
MKSKIEMAKGLHLSHNTENTPGLYNTEEQSMPWKINNLVKRIPLWWRGTASLHIPRHCSLCIVKVTRKDIRRTVRLICLETKPTYQQGSLGVACFTSLERRLTQPPSTPPHTHTQKKKKSKLSIQSVQHRSTLARLPASTPRTSSLLTPVPATLPVLCSKANTVCIDFPRALWLRPSISPASKIYHPCTAASVSEQPLQKDKRRTSTIMQATPLVK